MKRKRLARTASSIAGCVMDPRKLLYLATIIEQGSLAKAAKHLAISQPALSKSMDRLESELGIKLLERGPMGITPTTFGEILYSHARLIREEMDFAETRFQKVQKGHARIVTFGTLPSFCKQRCPTCSKSLEGATFPHFATSSGKKFRWSSFWGFFGTSLISL